MDNSPANCNTNENNNKPLFNITSSSLLKFPFYRNKEVKYGQITLR